MSSQVTVTASSPFCEDSEFFSGAVEVVEVVDARKGKTIGLRLRVGDRYVRLPRNRVSEIQSALKSAEHEASVQYKRIVEGMNHE